jgi:hypothetical protein
MRATAVGRGYLGTRHLAVRERSARMDGLRGPDCWPVNAELRPAHLIDHTVALKPCSVARCRDIDSLGFGCSCQDSV